MAPPKLLTWGRYNDISEQLEEAKGKGELENVMSDIEEAGKDDPSIFAGHHGRPGKAYLDEAIKYKNVWEEDKIRDNLNRTLIHIERILEERRQDGGRSRRKTRRHRGGVNAPPAFPPQPGTCYEGVEWGPNGQPVYFGMYSNAQPEPMYPERANAGGADVRGWFTIAGEASVRRHYYRDSLRVVPCQIDDVDMDAGRRRKTRSTRPSGRRGRKSRRKSLRQRK